MNKFRINLSDGAGYNGPYINKFSSGFDAIEFYADKSFPENCTYAVIYSVCGDVGMSTDNDGNVNVSKDADTGKTLVTWQVGREVTCESGVVIYQVVVYTADEDGKEVAVWYSPQGRIVVGDSIDTTEYETASIAAEPSLVTQLITKSNKLSQDSADHLRRIDILEQLQQVAERRMDEMYGEFSGDVNNIGTRLAELNDNICGLTDNLADAVTNISGNSDRISSLAENFADTDESLNEHINDGTIHMNVNERERAEHFFSLYDANGMLSLSVREAEETNALLSEVVGVPGNLRIAFMSGAHSLEPAPYNKLKLLSSYGICDYVLNGGGFAPKGKSLSVSEALEIAKAAGKGTLSVCGDGSPDANVWGNIFCVGDKPYYYTDDIRKNIRLVVLDTAHMDNTQIHWFVKEALRPGVIRPIIIFSHRNLGDFILKSDRSSLFKKIFKYAQEGGSLTLTDEVICNDAVVCQTNVSAKFDDSVEIVATVHGNCGVDSCKNDLSANFCNLGVADDFPDREARMTFEECKVAVHSDITKSSDIVSVVRAKTNDIVSDGKSVIEFKPTANTNETYLVSDVYDIRNVEGYVVIETNIRLGANVPDDGLFCITTNQSRPVSKTLCFGDLSAKADDDGWIRLTVVICKKTGDANYGLYNTYINGISHNGWHNGYLGEMLDNGAVRSEIRLVAKGLTTDSVLYYGRSRVYASSYMLSEELLTNGLSDNTFCYGEKLYNSGYELEFLNMLGGDKGCYEVLCIDTGLKKIKCCRFGFGLARSADWQVPPPVFE